MLDEIICMELRKINGLMIGGSNEDTLWVVKGHVQIEYGVLSDGTVNIGSPTDALHICPQSGSMRYNFKFPFSETEGQIYVNSGGEIIIPRDEIDLILHTNLRTFPKNYVGCAVKATVKEVNTLMGVYEFKG